MDNFQFHLLSQHVCVCRREWSTRIASVHAVHLSKVYAFHHCDATYARTTQAKNSIPHQKHAHFLLDAGHAKNTFFIDWKKPLKIHHVYDWFERKIGQGQLRHRIQSLFPINFIKTRRKEQFNGFCLITFEKRKKNRRKTDIHAWFYASIIFFQTFFLPLPKQHRDTITNSVKKS